MQLDQKALELLDEGLEILTNLTDSIARHGNYSPESTCTFIDQAASSFREAKGILQAVQPVPVVAEDAHQFKNFHRLLCERFGYCHDEKDWRRDQVSLIEHIAALTAAVSAKPVAYTSQAQLDKLAKGKGGTIWSEPLPYHDDIALYAAPLPARGGKADD